MKKNYNFLILILEDSLVNLPTPSSISMNWNWGSTLGSILMIQILSGILISFHYSSTLFFAFESVDHLSRDVNLGWLSRGVHANAANLFFVFIYLHIGRGLYYSLFKNYKVWFSGVILFLVLMIIAFLGYVLPWGQSSYWGATVITNLVSSIPYLGENLVIWLWGGYSVSNPTLSRFYSLHFFLPMILFVLMVLHLFFLHETGSNNSLGLSVKFDTIFFHPFFTLKDMSSLIFIMMILIGSTMYSPSILMDPDNFIQANSLVTPKHIQPEWYFLFAYAILRAIPSKLGGVLALSFSILILLLPIFTKKFFVFIKIPTSIQKSMFWGLVSVFVILTWIGSNPVESPFEIIGKMYSFLYFILSGSIFF